MCAANIGYQGWFHFLHLVNGSGLRRDYRRQYLTALSKMLLECPLLQKLMSVIGRPIFTVRSHQAHVQKKCRAMPGVIDEQHATSLWRLHVAAQNRGSASLLHSLTFVLAHQCAKKKPGNARLFC
ncbi:MAG: hypothetical protein HKN15_01030 [Xanthomonadales bacterium]|nr:hypothetical protein [Xanthomonadales bacterium]